ncbi:MAG TPA: M48 family metallopeptidase [Candidatus Acidoferrales bacterium]|nr:M48 family metallopeptidase [Candidatus Acidoferrales bacterium]
MHHSIAFLIAFMLLFSPNALTAKNKKKRNADIEGIGERDINKGSWNLYSPEREMELGERLARDVERSSRLLYDPVVTAYIRQLADRMARHSDLRMPLQVRVIDSDEINAFALPGGHFFINTGLILETQNEAELASVIAHEIAHVAARHATKQITRAQLWNWVSFPLIFVGGPVGLGLQQGLMLAVPLTFLKFSRNFEREADLLGQQYHYAAGYDPAAFLDFFERMKQKERKQHGGIAKAFSTHPMTKERIVAAEHTIEADLPPRDEYVVTTSRHDEIRAHLRDRLFLRVHRDEKSGPVLRKRGVPQTSPLPGEKRLPF